MRVSVGLPITGATTGVDLADCALAAERLGYDSVFVTDHPAPDERWLSGVGHDTLDPFVALSFVAAVTSTIGLHTNLVVLPYRNPYLTAKAVASLDALSDGRVILGVGVGYLESEFHALGADFDSRAAAADRALVTMRAAWTGEPQPPHGTVVLPRPIRRPHPPIWVGGNSMAAVRRAVTHGDGWSPMPSPESAVALLGTPALDDIDVLRARIARLRELLDESGRREPFDVAVIPTELSGFASREWSSSAAVDEIGALRDAGGTVLVVDLPAAETGAWIDQAERLMSGVLRWVH